MRRVVFVLAVLAALTSPALGAPPPELTAVSTVDASGYPALGPAIARTAEQLAENFFDQATGAGGTRWLSVGALQGNSYAYQFYARDTLESARGFVFAGPAFRRDLEAAIDWFALQQRPDGFIPLWFRGGAQITPFALCPYNRESSEEGGVKQYDHVAKFVDAVLTAYRWNGDRGWLAAHRRAAAAALAWLDLSTDSSGLIYARISSHCGADWADTVLRAGYATFVEVDYYEATLAMAAIEDELDHPSEALADRHKAAVIRAAINQKLWRTSVPRGYDGPAFGHYIGWSDASGAHDYFEVDSNSYAVASGVASEERADSILGFLDAHWDEVVNVVGATRDVFGLYDESDQEADTTHAAQFYQNGGYWDGVSMYLADALRRVHDAIRLAKLLNLVVAAMDSSGDEGRYEWYRSDGSPGANRRQSWSLGFPLLLIYGDIAGINPTPEGIAVHPCVDPSLGTLTVQLSYRGEAQRITVAPGCFGPAANGSLLGHD